MDSDWGLPPCLPQGRGHGEALTLCPGPSGGSTLVGASLHVTFGKRVKGKEQGPGLRGPWAESRLGSSGPAGSLREMIS